MKQERKKQEEQLIEMAKAYFEKHGLNDAFDRFFARNDVMRKMQGAYNSFERNLASIINDLDAIECSDELRAKAREVIKIVSGKKEVMDADIKLTMMCTLYGLFDAMEAWIDVDDQVLRPFKEMMVLEKGTQMIQTFDVLCEGLVSKMLGKTLALICESMNKEEEARLLMRMLEKNLGEPVGVVLVAGSAS